MKLNLKKTCCIEDAKGNPKGFGPGEVEVTDAEAKALQERFPKAIVSPKAATSETHKEGGK